MLNRLLRARRGRDAAPATMVGGTRAYAVGDVHGRLDLLDRMLGMIEEDDASRPPADTIVILLGDVVDRGPDSAGVVERLRCLKQEYPSTVRLLLGNHEEVFLAALGGDPQAVRVFCRIGGRETLLSYGVDQARYERMDYDEVASALAELVPDTHRRFVGAFEDMIVLGDYAFVHAGIDPMVPLADQRPGNLRWIRQPFLAHRGRLEKVVVHGHTVHHEVESHVNRIGIDTGAYETGRLSAICLEGSERRVIQT